MKRFTCCDRVRAFTLVEILIVIAILGILAAIVVPKYVDANEQTQEAAVRKSLQVLREQIALYHFKENAFPDDLDALVDDGYLSATPQHPGDTGNWVYNATDGTVTSSLNADW